MKHEDSDVNDHYDSPWKQIIENHFDAFLKFFFSDIFAALDWSRTPVFLDKELNKIRPGNEVGKKHVDKLVKVHLEAGSEIWLLIHIEVQADRDSDFARRMFIYNYRLYDKYQLEVVSLALLGDTHHDWRPNRFGYGRFGSRTELHFPIVKLVDYGARLATLEKSDNPFALAVLAHLISKRTKGDQEGRFRWKLKLYRLLVREGWEPKSIRDLFIFFDYVLTLPKELDKQISQTLHKETGGATMQYVTSFERMAEEKGIEKGIEKGVQRGMAKGVAEILTLMLGQKFGDLPSWAREKINNADISKLKAWTLACNNKGSLEEILA